MNRRRRANAGTLPGSSRTLSNNGGVPGEENPANRRNRTSTLRNMDGPSSAGERHLPSNSGGEKQVRRYEVGEVCRRKPAEWMDFARGFARWGTEARSGTMHRHGIPPSSSSIRRTFIQPTPGQWSSPVPVRSTKASAGPGTQGDPCAANLAPQRILAKHWRIDTKNCIGHYPFVG